MARHLAGVAAGDQCRDRDDAAVAGGEIGPLPEIREQDLVGIVGQGRGDGPDIGRGYAGGRFPLLRLGRGGQGQHGERGGEQLHRSPFFRRSVVPEMGGAAPGD
jgi:hypothetical protein